MNKYPLKGTSKKTTAVRKIDPDVVDVVPPAPRTGVFFSFQYTHTEFSSEGGRTRVKAKQARLENGKLSMESFEGELDGKVYDEVVHRMQQLVLGQTASLLRSMSWLLPPMRRPRSDRE